MRLLVLGLLFPVLTGCLHAAAAQQVWTIPFPLVAAPAVRADGSVVAQSADTLLLVANDGTERWRVAVHATTSSSAQPPMIDDAGNIVVLTSTGIGCYTPDGGLKWSIPLQYPSSYTSLALGQQGQVVVKSGDDWYALDASGHALWSRLTGSGPIDFGAPHNSASPAIITPDGRIRSVNSADMVEIRSIDNGAVVASDPQVSEGSQGSALLGLGPSAESLVVAARQPPFLDPPVADLVTPSAGNFRVRWTMSAGTGVTWSDAFALGSPAVSGAELVQYGLCAPSGEVLVSTTQGTVIMPHDGIGSRRWTETAFAICENGDVLCTDGTQMFARHADQSLAWSTAGEGKHFTLAPDGRVYGGTQTLSAYDVGVGPAAGPWTQPRGDATQRARAPAIFGPFSPSVASDISAPTSQQLYASYAGQITASPYVQGPGTLTWEKDNTDIGAAADDYSFVVRSASAASTGSYRLRVDTARGPVTSPPIAVTVVAPSPIRPGLYWGKLSSPDKAPYCLEIGADRSVRYLSATGDHLTPAMGVRLDPQGVYPWSLPISPNSEVTLRADAAGVSVAWQNHAAEPATPAAAVLQSGARTGWYDGNYVGPLFDDCVTELALLPDGTLIGKMNGPVRWLNSMPLALKPDTLPLALDPDALSQTLSVNSQTAAFADHLTVTFDTAGNADFVLHSYPYATSLPVEFQAFAPGAAPDTRLVNLSARSRIGGDAGTLVAGFAVASLGHFLVRGVGPTLAHYGVGEPFAAPAVRLTLPNGNLVSENQSWATSSEAETAALIDAANQSGAFQLDAGSADSALVATLDPGLYTALLSSRAEGNALTEVYAIPTNGAGAEPRLVNLSARGKLTASNSTLIIGFVHATAAARRILIRGIGPGLKPFVGSAIVCANPRLRVFDATGNLICSNNDWQDFGTTYAPKSQLNTVTQAASASGAFPLQSGSRDAAVVLNLPGGSYTVHLESEDGSLGEVLFEVYAVP